MRKGDSARPGQMFLFEESAPEGRDSSIAVAPDDVRPAPALADETESAIALVDETPAVAPVEGHARRQHASMPRQQATPRVPPSPHVTLDQAIRDYIKYLSAINRSQHTIKSFHLDLRLLQGRLGDPAVGAIDTSQLRQFMDWVRETRANAPNSRRRKVATLKNFFSYLRDEGYLATSPADAVPYPEAYVALPEFLEEDDALRLVEVTEDNAFWRALVVLMLDTGLKRDEVLALRVADIHLDDDNVSGSYLVVREKDAAKRLRSRKLPVSERLRDALRAYYKAPHHVQDPPVPQLPRAGDSRVFDISVRGINFIVEECGKRAGIVTSKPRLTPQVLRETFAVSQMRARVQEERRCQARGWNGEQMQLLTLRHDAKLLELLGLKEDPDTARKYRQLVEV